MSSVATLPAPSRYGKLSYLTVGVLIWFHIQAVAAFWSFSWTNLFVALFLYWVAIGLGISMGYHRLHTHRGFKTYRLFDYFLAICGTLTLEGGPIFWVSTHRVHHQHSDQELDPHTPRVNGFWAHIGWIIFGEAHHNDTDELHRQDPLPRLQRQPPRRRAADARRREDAALPVHDRGSDDLDEAVDRGVHLAGDRRPDVRVRLPRRELRDG